MLQQNISDYKSVSHSKPLGFDFPFESFSAHYEVQKVLNRISNRFIIVDLIVRRGAGDVLVTDYHSESSNGIQVVSSHRYILAYRVDASIILVVSSILTCTYTCFRIQCILQTRSCRWY